MTDHEMIEVLRERGYRVIRAGNIWTFWAEQLMDECLEHQARDAAGAREYLTRALEDGLGHAIAKQLRGQLKPVRTYDKDLRAYRYRTELTVVRLERT